MRGRGDTGLIVRYKILLLPTGSTNKNEPGYEIISYILTLDTFHFVILLPQPCNQDLKI